MVTDVVTAFMRFRDLPKECTQREPNASANGDPFFMPVRRCLTLLIRVKLQAPFDYNRRRRLPITTLLDYFTTIGATPETSVPARPDATLAFKLMQTRRADSPVVGAGRLW